MQVTRPSMRLPGLGLPRPERRGRISAMIALADVLFQLLIFFMLSANLMGYSMLLLQAGAIRDTGKGEAAPSPGTTVTEASATAVWTLRPDGIVASGQQFNIEHVSMLAEALAAQGTRNLLIVLQPQVPVQDVVTVLETLAARGIDSVQIAEATGAG